MNNYANLLIFVSHEGISIFESFLNNEIEDYPLLFTCSLKEAEQTLRAYNIKPTHIVGLFTATIN